MQELPRYAAETKGQAMKNDDGKPDFEEVLVPNGDGSTHSGWNIHPRVWHRLFAAAASVPMTAAAMQLENVKAMTGALHSLPSAAVEQADALLTAMDQPVDTPPTGD